MRHLAWSQSCRVPNFDLQRTVIGGGEFGGGVETQYVYLAFVEQFDSSDADGVAALCGEFGSVYRWNAEVGWLCVLGKAGQDKSEESEDL
jgi:hypothetical protein